MRIVKPQAVLVQTAPTQIGSAAQLRLSVGVGFRLSDPRCLAHEALVWEAVKAARSDVPLYESTLPKQHAEWLLAGRGTTVSDAADIGRDIDWICSASLDNVRKSVSCKAVAQKGLDGQAVARLTIDHRHAALGPNKENPLGSTVASPPLQQLVRTGVHPLPLSAMGPLQAQWPERARWHPGVRITDIETDGTHMGWPAQTDWRYFQLAAPDQWHRQSTWPVGAGYSMTGFGDAGQGFEGHLPALHPQALTHRRGETRGQEMGLAQQTVWFLPDFDLGVMWWNGSVGLDYVLDNSVAQITLALNGPGPARPPGALVAVADRRGQLHSPDFAAQSDELLMPDLRQGWAWQLITDAENHPTSSLGWPTYMLMKQRMADESTMLEDAARTAAAFAADMPASPAKALQRIADGTAQLPRAPTTDWRQRLQSDAIRELKGAVVRDADLQAMTLQGWKFENTRFVRCKLDRSVLRECELLRTEFVDCSMSDTQFDSLTWDGGGLTRCISAGSVWTNGHFTHLLLDAVTWARWRIDGGHWADVSLNGSRLDHCQWHNVRMGHVCLHATHATGGLGWNDLQLDGLDVVDCTLPGLQIFRSRIDKFSAVQTDLRDSRWTGCRLRSATWASETDMSNSHLQDCHVDQACMTGIDASGMRLDHCTFTQLNAAGLHAPGARWSGSELDGAQLMQANLSGAHLHRCSLREAMFYGADLRDAAVHECNLIAAAVAWTDFMSVTQRKSNLESGLIELPRQ